MQTTLKDGLIECCLYGSLTAIDCESLHSEACQNCFIYTFFKSVSNSDSSFDKRESHVLNEKTLNNITNSLN